MHDIKPTRRKLLSIVTLLDIDDIRVTKVTDIFGEVHYNVTAFSHTKQYIRLEDAEYDLSLLLSSIDGVPNVVILDRAAAN